MATRNLHEIEIEACLPAGLRAELAACAYDADFRAFYADFVDGQVVIRLTSRARALAANLRAQG